MQYESTFDYDAFDLFDLTAQHQLALSVYYIIILLSEHISISV